MRIFTQPEALLQAVGEQFGPTAWLLVEQARIDAFANATDDHQWIHVDVERSREGPFGTTIAHGYLTLSLFSAFLPRLFDVRDLAMSVNVGLNRVRFLSPVLEGTSLRASATLASASEKGGGIEIVLAVTIEAKGQERPICVLEPVIRLYPIG